MVSGTFGPALSSASEARKEGIQRPRVLFSCESAPLLPLRSKGGVRCSPRFRRCSNATTSVHRRLWPSVDSVGVGHSEPPVKESRLRSLEPSAERQRQRRSAGPHETRSASWTLWDLFLHVPTQKQEAPSPPSEGRGGPNAVGRSSSQRFHQFSKGKYDSEDPDSQPYQTQSRVSWCTSRLRHDQQRQQHDENGE